MPLGGAGRLDSDQCADARVVDADAQREDPMAFLLAAFKNVAVLERLLAAIMLVAAWSHSPPAAATDLHDYWDRNCATCHGHAGAFARRFLAARDGNLQGRHHVEDLAGFLRNHYLDADLVEPVGRMLLAQVATEPRFQAECGRCHASAAALARDSLAVRDGVLVNRESGRPTAAFLQRHAGIKPEDVPFYVELLRRVVSETGSR
jgi:mono/diheme cytochrome c family protein